MSILVTSCYPGSLTSNGVAMWNNERISYIHHSSKSGGASCDANFDISTNRNLISKVQASGVPSGYDQCQSSSSKLELYFDDIDITTVDSLELGINNYLSAQCKNPCTAKIIYDIGGNKLETYIKSGHNYKQQDRYQSYFKLQRLSNGQFSMNDQFSSKTFVMDGMFQPKLKIELSANTAHGGNTIVESEISDLKIKYHQPTIDAKKEDPVDSGFPNDFVSIIKQFIMELLAFFNIKMEAR